MRLRELKISNSLLQCELAKIIGVSGQTILNWENCIYEPKINQLIALADYFNATVDYLNERKTTVDTIDILSNILKKVPHKKVVNFICEYNKKH